MDARTFLADLFLVAVFFAEEEEEVGGKSSDMFRFRQCVVGLTLVLGRLLKGVCGCARKTQNYKLTSAVSSIN